MKTYKLVINGEKYEARILEYSGSHAKVKVNGTDYQIQIDDDTIKPLSVLAAQEKAVPLAPAFSSNVDMNSGEIKSPIPGVIVKIMVKEGDQVKKGQPILSLEAMKMESDLAAPIDGKIQKIHVKERAPVQEGDLLITIENKGLKKPEKTVKTTRISPSPVTEPAVLDKTIYAPIPGIIIDILVQPGDNVDDNSVLLILEAMKMESEIRSHLSGKISKIIVRKGDSVQEGDALIELEA